MSKRSEIIDGKNAAAQKKGLVYTEVLGWIDLGHAQGNDIRNLLSMIKRGEASGKDFYDIRYSQGMTGLWGQLRSGKMMTLQIRRGRTDWEQKSIALMMMMTIARKFEAFQAAFPNNMVTDSGFSGEDLVSDLLGFYRVVSINNPFHLIRPVSKSEALKRWDYYGKIGSWKNDTFQPLLFPIPDEKSNSKPYLGQLPTFMKQVFPYNNFSSGDVRFSRGKDKTFFVLGSDNNRMGL